MHQDYGARTTLWLRLRVLTFLVIRSVDVYLSTLLTQQSLPAEAKERSIVTDVKICPYL